MPGASNKAQQEIYNLFDQDTKGLPPDEPRTIIDKVTQSSTSGGSSGHASREPYEHPNPVA